MSETIWCPFCTNYYLKCDEVCPYCALSAAVEENRCDACAGTGKISIGNLCMCGGSGKMSDAARYLREELIKTCEEQDRYKADSEALDWIIKTFPGFVKTSLTQLDYPVEFRDALRKRLEGK